ncbi:hypothetical protein [Psychroserpens luteus]|uniref:Lipoprotein n=1 Tax=Psychroserpens luteus TaxID=1434066 RepID=A0ABW5ZW09_9FLAO|nr:hypothetical protein [Psychroserpens luteus]
MKNIKILFFLSLMTTLIYSCEKENNEELVKIEQSAKLSKADMALILFGSENSRSGDLPFVADFNIRTESDLVSAEGGCYTVNVRVYIDNTETGQSYQVANDNVQVGDCPDQNRTSDTESCNGTLSNGHNVIENGTNDHFCLYEVLTRNSEVYNQYLNSISELVN